MPRTGFIREAKLNVVAEYASLQAGVGQRTERLGEERLAREQAGRKPGGKAKR